MQARVFAPFFKGIMLSNISGKDSSLQNLGFRTDPRRGKIVDSKYGNVLRVEKDDPLDSCMSLVIAILNLEAKRQKKRPDEDSIYEYHTLLTNLFGLEDKDAIEVEMEIMDPKKYEPAWKRSIAMMISCFETQFREQVIRAIWRMNFMDDDIDGRSTIVAIAGLLDYSPEECEALRHSSFRD